MIGVMKSAFGKLRKMFNKGYEYYLTIYLVINVIWIFLGMFLCNYSRFFLYSSLSISYIVFLIFNCFIILSLFGLKKIGNDKIDVFLIMLVVFGIIATIFAHNSVMSLYGFRNRYEGLFQLLYYYSLMFLSTNVYIGKNKRKIISFILFFGLINVFVCSLQVFDFLRFIPINNRGITLGQGFISNSNFFGSYMVLCLGISIGFFLYNCNGKKYSIICLILCLCFYAGLLMSSALSGMVGLFFIGLCNFVFFVFLFIKKDVTKLFVIKHIVLIVCFIFISIILSYFGKTTITGDIIKFTRETSEIVKGNFDDSYGTDRIYIWKNTINVVPKYLVHGVGIDNFYYAFGEEPLFTKYKTFLIYYDKAHNEYLQKLVCEGMFSCITYIGMLLVVFIASCKKIFKGNNYITIGLFLAFVGYSIQAFFNISVIEVAPLFLIVCGLLYDRKCDVLKDLQIL